SPDSALTIRPKGRLCFAMRGNGGNETSSVRICRRDGADHPSGHDVGGGCAPQVSDLPASTCALVLRAPTCASKCSYSVCWVWCSQSRSCWSSNRGPCLGRWPSWRDLETTNPMHSSFWTPAHCRFRAEESRPIPDQLIHEKARPIMRRIA